MEPISRNSAAPRLFTEIVFKQKKLDGVFLIIVY